MLLIGVSRLVYGCNVEVYITAPSEGAKATFNNATPGVKEITCTGYTVPSSYTDSIQWTCEDVNGTTESFSNNATGGSVTLTLTTLPSSNSEFGSFWIRASVAGDSDTHTIKLFFPGEDYHTNHPGSGSGTTPNWYFYWKQTSASYGTPDYRTYGITETVYEGGAWKYYLTAGDNDPYTPPEGDNGGNQLTGIDDFAWTCRHEGRHVTTHTNWYPNDYDSGIDGDLDHIPNANEAALGGTQQNPINGGPFTPGVLDTDSDGRRDDEDYTCNTQASWSETSANGSDWANPGHQYY